MRIHRATTRERHGRGIGKEGADWTGLRCSSSSSNPAHGRAKGETGNRRSDCGGEQPRQAPAPSFSLQLGGMYHLHTDALCLFLFLFLFFSMMFSMISLAPSTDKEAWQPLGVLRLNLKGGRRRGRKVRNIAKDPRGGWKGSGPYHDILRRSFMRDLDRRRQGMMDLARLRAR